MFEKIGMNFPYTKQLHVMAYPKLLAHLYE
jgi:hypothetical protein